MQRAATVQGLPTRHSHRAAGAAWVCKLVLALGLIGGTAAALAGVDANRANEAELDGVRGLGPDSTARILKAREAGPFADWADLMARVKGIKAATASRLSHQGLTVNGLPYPAALPTHTPMPAPPTVAPSTPSKTP